jgi:hypothetical protein
VDYYRAELAGSVIDDLSAAADAIEQRDAEIERLEAEVERLRGVVRIIDAQVAAYMNLSISSSTAIRAIAITLDRQEARNQPRVRWADSAPFDLGTDPQDAPGR